MEPTDHLLSTRSVSDCSGMMTVAIIMLVVVVAGIMAVVFMSADRVLARLRDPVERAHTLPVAETAVASYLYLLRAGVLGPGGADDLAKSYLPGEAALRAVADPAAGDVIPSATLPATWNLDDVHTSIPDAARLTVKDPTSDPSVSGYWQLYRVERGVQGAGSMRITFRAWMANQSTVTARPTYTSVSYTSGSFPPVLAAANTGLAALGAEIDGPVLANGYADDAFGNRGRTPNPDGERGGDWIYPYLSAFGVLHCLEGGAWGVRGGYVGDTGIKGQRDAALSVEGCTDISSPTPYRNAQESYVDLSQIDNTFDAIRAACAAGDPAVVCLAPPTGDSYEATASGSTLAVVGGPSVSSTSVRAVLFQGDVRLRGTISGSFAIAAQLPPDRPGAATVTIDDDFGTAGGDGDSLGLYAQGDVVVATGLEEAGGTSDACPVTHIDVAIVSAVGTLTLDPRWTSREWMSDPRPQCTNGILVEGALFGHRVPRLAWTWGPAIDTEQVAKAKDDPWVCAPRKKEDDGAQCTGTPDPTLAWAGYLHRRYQWDTRYLTDPPPFAPTFGEWSISGYREGNLDCIDAVDGAPECA